MDLKKNPTFSYSGVFSGVNFIDFIAKIKQIFCLWFDLVYKQIKPTKIITGVSNEAIYVYDSVSWPFSECDERQYACLHKSFVQQSTW